MLLYCHLKFSGLSDSLRVRLAQVTSLCVSELNLNLHLNDSGSALSRLSGAEWLINAARQFLFCSSHSISSHSPLFGPVFGRIINPYEYNVKRGHVTLDQSARQKPEARTCLYTFGWHLPYFGILNSKIPYEISNSDPKINWWFYYHLTFWILLYPCFHE